MSQLVQTIQLADTAERPVGCCSILSGRRRPHGTPAHGDVMVTSPELVKRMNHLDKVVEEKNQHITELKQVIQRLENGRVMRALNRVQKLRGRS